MFTNIVYESILFNNLPSPLPGLPSYIACVHRCIIHAIAVAEGVCITRNPKTVQSILPFSPEIFGNGT